MRHFVIFLNFICCFIEMPLYAQSSPTLFCQIEDVNMSINGQKVTAKSWVLCPDLKGAELVLKSPDDPNINSCRWEVLDYSQHDNVLCSSSEKIYNVHKGCGNTKTCIYKLKVIMKDGSTNYFYFIVYILEGIEITEANNITESLELGCNLNINVQLLGIGMDKVNFISSQERVYLVATLKENGVAANYYTDLNFWNGKSSYWLFSSLLNNSSLDESILNIYAVTKNEYCKSNELKIVNYKLEITKFKHKSAMDPKVFPVKNFRVVVNAPIEFDLSGSQLISDFKWTMADGFFELGNNLKRSGTDMTMIRDFGKMPDSYMEFGKTHGIIRVDCMLPGGTKVMFTSAKYSNLPYMSNQQIAEIYYLKNGFDYSQERYGVPPILVPNWFKYWTQFLPFNRKIVKYVFYANSKSNDYGVTERPAKQPNNFYKFNSQTQNLYQRASESLGNLHGLHCAYSTTVHETWHAELMGIKLWPNGYDRSLDKDAETDRDKRMWDLYEDSYELKIGPNKFLSPHRDDNYIYHDEHGFDFEEQEAREKAKYIYDIFKFDEFDWSFEPRIDKQNSQGKNWKK